MSNLLSRHARHSTQDPWTRSKNVVRAFFATVTVGLVAVTLATGPAKAVPVTEPDSIPANSIDYTDLGPQSVGQKQLIPNAVGYNQVGPNSIWQKQIAKNVIDWQRLTPSLQMMIASKQGEKGDKGDQGIQGPPGDPATDKLGGATDVAFGPQTITDVGGSFGKFTSLDGPRATKLGQFELTPGTYLLTSQFRADRTEAGAAGTRPQLALRVDDGTDWGKDFGTVMGNDLSPTAGRELYGSGFKLVTVTENTTVLVYGFGYNDDSSAAGSGQYTMSATVAKVLVG